MSDSFYFFTWSDHNPENPFDGKYVSSRPPRNEKTSGMRSELLSKFVGLYWFIEMPGGKHKALSTEEIAETLRKNRTVRSISGPFSSREEAAKSLERYWEMIMDDSDE